MPDIEDLIKPLYSIFTNDVAKEQEKNLRLALYGMKRYQCLCIHCRLKSDEKDHAILRLANEIKALAFPELSPGYCSHGVGSKALTQDDNRAYEIYKVVAHALWKARGGAGGWSVDSDDPYLLNYSGDAKIPFEVKGEG